MCCDEESEQLREQEAKRRELVTEKQEKKQRLGERERERERERVEKWRNEQNNKMYKLAWVPPKFGQVA